MSRLLLFWRSTLGKKVVMGVTGLIMVAFLVGHMLGNLQVFQGPEKINAYSHFLHSLGEGLWAIRAVLLLSLVLHVVAAVQLTLLDRAARPANYARRDLQAATPASRSLRWGGVLILVFLVYHLMHFTTGQVHPDFIEGDVYHNLVTGFRSPWVVAFYLVTMIAVGFHVFHGAWSSLRSLGLSRPRPNPLQRPFVRVLAVAVWLGFTMIPLAIGLGWVR